MDVFWFAFSFFVCANTSANTSANTTANNCKQLQTTANNCKQQSYCRTHTCLLWFVQFQFSAPVNFRNSPACFHSTSDQHFKVTVLPTVCFHIACIGLLRSCSLSSPTGHRRLFLVSSAVKVFLLLPATSNGCSRTNSGTGVETLQRHSQVSRQQFDDVCLCFYPFSEGRAMGRSYLHTPHSTYFPCFSVCVGSSLMHSLTIRTAKTWPVPKEQVYIQKEARKLFRRNKNLTNPEEVTLSRLSL